jgi:hypothetical protein
MLVNGKPFGSSTTYLTTYRELRTLAGNASWFTEFRPIRFPATETIQLLMLEFFSKSSMLFHVWFLCLFYGRNFAVFQGYNYAFRFDRIAYCAINF